VELLADHFLSSQGLTEFCDRKWGPLFGDQEKFSLSLYISLSRRVYSATMTRSSTIGRR
jgi:hypothetical protein